MPASSGCGCRAAFAPRSTRGDGRAPTRDVHASPRPRAHAGVAQLVEQLIRNQQVSGSSPLAGSIRINNLQGIRGKGENGRINTVSRTPPTEIVNLSPLLLLGTSLLSGLLAAWITLAVNASRDKRRIKRDVLRRLAGNRYFLTAQGLQLPSSGEPFVALNEVFIVFNDDKEVLDAVKQLRASGGASEHVVALIKRMATAAGVQIHLDDAFIDYAFTPGPSLQRPRPEGGRPVTTPPSTPAGRPAGPDPNAAPPTLAKALAHNVHVVQRKTRRH